MTDKEIRVWAPDAKRMDVDIEPLGGVVTTTPMTRQPGGWWTAATDRPAPYDYAFRGDGGPPLPGPPRRGRRRPAAARPAQRLAAARGARPQPHLRRHGLPLERHGVAGAQGRR